MIKQLLRIATRSKSLNWAIVDQAMVSGVNFLTTVVLARYLGVEEFGIFALVWLVVLFVAGLHGAVVVSPMMSIAPKQNAEDEDAYFTTVLIHQLGFTLIAFGLIFFGAKLAGQLKAEWEFSSLALVTAATATAFVSQDFVRRHFFTKQNGRAAFINDAICYGGQLAVLLALLQTTEMDSVGALWVVCGTSALAAVAGTPFLGKPVWQRTLFDQVTRRHWLFSRWLLVSALIHWISGNAFVLAAGAILGPAAVGALKAAQTIMGVTHVYMQALANVVPIRAAQHFHGGGPQALRRYLYKAASVGGSITIAIAIAAAVAPETWLTLTYGEDFAVHSHLLQWYAIVYVLMFGIFLLRCGLRAVEYTKPITVAHFLIAGFAVPIAYPLIERMGLGGTMIGILATEVILLLTLGIALNRYLAKCQKPPSPVSCTIRD